MEDFPDILDVESIRLRKMAMDDLPHVIDQLGDRRLAQWLASVRHPFGRAEAEELLAFSREPMHRVRIIVSKGRPVGCLALAPAVWFWLDPAHQQQGIMRRALQAAIMAHFAQPAAPLIATCREDNDLSLALLRRLGFSQSPIPRRMFFQSCGTSHPCQDYVMTPEQWYFLHPPRFECGAYSLRPAGQKDAPEFQRMLSGPGAPQSDRWPRPEAAASFIEVNRCRAIDHGLFVIEDEFRRNCGLVLLESKVARPPPYSSQRKMSHVFSQHLRQVLIKRASNGNG